MHPSAFSDELTSIESGCSYLEDYKILKPTIQEVKAQYDRRSVSRSDDPEYKTNGRLNILVNHMSKEVTEPFREGKTIEWCDVTNTMIEILKHQKKSSILSITPEDMIQLWNSSSGLQWFDEEYTKRLPKMRCEWTLRKPFKGLDTDKIDQVSINHFNFKI